MRIVVTYTFQASPNAYPFGVVMTRYEKGAIFHPNVQCSHHGHEHGHFCGSHHCGEEKHGCAGQ